VDPADDRLFWLEQREYAGVITYDQQQELMQLRRQQN